MLAALLLRAGHVVPTEQLVDELYGAEPPPTATASLQNAVVALRKVLGPDVLVTRPPGYLLAVSPDQIDARRFEHLLADARRASGGRSVESSSCVRSGCGAGRRLPSSPSRSGPRPRARRLDELRLVAVEERIAADLELGGAADVVPELEALVREHPLRERLRELLMLALYRAGRQAEALSAYTAAHEALDELGIEPGEELRRLQAAILRQEAGVAGRERRRLDHDSDAEIVKAIVAGRVVPVLGLDGGADLASHLADAFGYPSDRPLDLARVSQYVATMNGSGPLYDELHRRFEAAVELHPVHRFLAALPDGCGSTVHHTS